MSQLNIYKASAGSGKTFRLTKEYIHLLFKYQENYRRILAVTFTNKATAEMKSRILIELNNLAKGNNSKYLNDLMSEYNLTPSEVQQKAQKILAYLLHDFSKFSVSTIDKFFQKIIRSFTREVGIQPGFSVETDQYEILSNVIDDFLLEIDQNPALKEWLSDLAFNTIEQGKKWDFKIEIQRLASEIFKEEFKEFDLQLIQKMSDKDFLKNYIQELQKIKSKFENDLTQIAQKALEIIQNNGLNGDDFKWGKSGVPGYFYKIIEKSEFEPGKRAISGSESIDDWFKKDSPKKDIIENALHHGLFEQLLNAVNYYNENNVNYNSANEILRHIHTLGILTDISKKLRTYCDEQNIFLISDAAKLIQIIIDNNESPFIYEKTGNIYKHFMIDEFQDTSKIQWHNFKPLIGNSLAQGSKNLVVGDVKQSIYRWRNSNWEILSEQIEKDFSQYQPEAKSLSINWRSKQNIIDYNNTIFCYSSKILQNTFNSEHDELSQDNNPYENKILNAYHDVFQDTPKNKAESKGYIKHNFIPEKGENTWKEVVKIRIPKIIEELQEKGYRLNDIALIVRTKAEGQEIANLLVEYKKLNSSKYRFDFISNDSLFLNNSSLVKFIISILNYILDPNDDINLSFLTYEYYSYLKPDQDKIKNLHQILTKKNTDAKLDWLKKFFSEDFISEFESIKQLPLYELLNRIIKIFKLNEIKSEIPYLKAFLDLVLDFGKKSTADIHSFLNWWNEEGNKKTLKVSEDQDAIRIITIHSAKGLEFKNVIIPYCNWDIDHDSHKSNIIWCNTKIEPFGQLDLIPLKYGKSLQNTVFKNNYLKEKFHAYVDNLNLLYVAFTRAENNLFLFSPLKESKTDKIKNIGDLLYYTYKEYKNYPSDKSLIELDKNWSAENAVFELGSILPADNETNEVSKELELNSFDSFDIKNKLRLKLHDNSFFTGQESAPFEKVNHGKIMHEIFENIRTEKDIQASIDQLIFDGKISLDKKDELISRINNTFKNEQIKNWFSDEWKVRTEAEIILTNGHTVRPDRVLENDEKIIIIDYKFGELEEEKHQKQVHSYIQVLSEMENKIIEGYLWYVDLNFIRKVE